MSLIRRISINHEVFFGKSCSRNFGGPGCHPDTSIDLENIALASTVSRRPIGMISEGYRTHRGVTGSMNFKKSVHFFCEKCAPGIFGAPDSHPSTLIDLQNNALASSESLEPKCMISEGYRTHRGVTGPMNFKKRRFFFGKSCSWEFWGPRLPSKHLN